MAAVSQYEERHRGIGGNPLSITRLWATIGNYGLWAERKEVLPVESRGLWAVFRGLSAISRGL